MKRSWIWILSLVMGTCFIVLLYFQARYAQTMIRMRKEQFDESVFRGLDQASRELERNETFRYLQDVVTQHELDLDLREMSSYDPDSFLRNSDATVDSALNATGYHFRRVGKHPGEFPRSLTMSRNSLWNGATERFQHHVQQAYVYERGLLDEVIYTVLYSASDLNFQDRLDARMLDNCLRSALERNGITLPFHFTVYTSDGRQIYQCSDYESKGEQYSYSQTLFRNDPTGKMGYVRVHFPNMNAYIKGILDMVIPAMAFTLILFITFVITVYLVVRQKKLSEMRNDFINNMTHEFKTPISTISIAAQMLADKSISKSDATYDRLGGVINAETRRLRFQVEKVLQMSLFDRNNIALKMAELDANEIIDNVVQTFSLKVSQSGGTIESKLEAMDPFINADEMHFTNIIFNLMDNAVKYKREDADLHLEVCTWNQGENLCISIQDNGIGIRKEDLKRIFEKFYRVHTGNQHNVKGFGLGLAYVKRMVDLHHGTIRAVSEVGQGTKFIITLPTNKD